MDLKISIEKTKIAKQKPEFSQAGFGQYFTDHMLIAEFDGKTWQNARITPYQALTLDPAASVLHYGQALFEGMKAFRHKSGEISLFRPEFNWKRMCAGADRLCMVAPSQSLFIDGILKLVSLDRDWVPSDVGQSLYIRPTLIGSEAFLGVKPSSKYIFFVILSPVASYYKEGLSPLSIWVEEEQVRASPGGLGATKAAANYAASLQAAKSARDKGHAQVLWLDVTHTFIEEVGTMNVFFVLKNGNRKRVITPGLDGTILSGNTRDCILTLARDRGFDVTETKVKLSEVMDWHTRGDLLEVFGTGTAALISPVGQLCFKDKVLKINEGRIGEVSETFYKALTGIQHGLVPDTHGWNKLVPIP